MPRTDIAAADIDLTAIMFAEEITAISRKRRMDDGWFFEVKLLDQVFPGYGDTVGEALADAKARNAEHAERLAA
jgi:hypothetical protein